MNESLNLEDAMDFLIFKALVHTDTQAEAAKRLGMTARNLQNIKHKKPLIWTSAQYTRTLLKSNTKKASRSSIDKQASSQSAQQP